MAAKGREQEGNRSRFVYVTRFGSHQCGGVLQLGGRRALGLWSPGFRAGRRQAGARSVAAGTPGGTEPPAGSRPRAPEASSPARASNVRSGSRPTAGGGATKGLTQKNLTKKFDFPVPLNEASKIMKKKVSVWNGVYKVISKMLEENEKYRLRLKCQQLSRERLTYLWICLPKKIMKSLKMEL